MSKRVHEILGQHAERFGREIVGTGEPSTAKLLKSRELCIEELRGMHDLNTKLKFMQAEMAKRLPVGKRLTHMRWVVEQNPMTNPDGNIGYFAGTVEDIPSV